MTICSVSSTIIIVDKPKNVIIKINAIDTVKVNYQGWTNIESSYIPNLNFYQNKSSQSILPWDISINFLYQSEN